ncbi:hypothetical protein SBOR_7917 [Sclerotinia borealis F-4128]|uniref:Uncharacterized protein n=1 Tax=Sclerotinia borealis (strain F-4128) TaxID=1432307 RepID=W9C7F8_SCLBF|nr:hypothetical protein SBOR_7917 [Sclerotinia borealis F-4128]
MSKELSLQDQIVKTQNDRARIEPERFYGRNGRSTEVGGSSNKKRDPSPFVKSPRPRPGANIIDTISKDIDNLVLKGSESDGNQSSSDSGKSHRRPRRSNGTIKTESLKKKIAVSALPYPSDGDSNLAFPARPPSIQPDPRRPRAKKMESLKKKIAVSALPYPSDGDSNLAFPARPPSIQPDPRRPRAKKMESLKKKIAVSALPYPSDGDSNLAFPARPPSSRDLSTPAPRRLRNGTPHPKIERPYVERPSDKPNFSLPRGRREEKSRLDDHRSDVDGHQELRASTKLVTTKMTHDGARTTSPVSMEDPIPKKKSSNRPLDTTGRGTDQSSRTSSHRDRPSCPRPPPRIRQGSELFFN